MHNALCLVKNTNYVVQQFFYIKVFLLLFTADQPPCIIIEYASHGNLRELLIACREAMELIKQPIRLLTSEETWLGKQKKHGATDKDTLSREKEEVVM